MVNPKGKASWKQAEGVPKGATQGCSKCSALFSLAEVSPHLEVVAVEIFIRAWLDVSTRSVLATVPEAGGTATAQPELSDSARFAVTSKALSKREVSFPPSITL